MPRYRNWIATCNNYTDEHISAFKSLFKGGDKAVYGMEIGDNDTPHLQCAMRFESVKSFNVIQTHLKGFHLIDETELKGTVIEGFSYCLKGVAPKEENRGNWTYDKPGPEYNGWHYGHFPVSQGKRTDCEKMRCYDTMREVLATAKNYTSVQFAQKYLEYNETPRKWKTKVYWYYGSTGTSKSWLAKKLAPNAYMKSSPTKWWNRYDGHSDVIMNDYRINWIMFSELLNLFDEYEHQIETKGGMRQFKPRRIFITTPKSPMETWDSRTEEDLLQLTRRLAGVFSFDTKYSIATYNRLRSTRWFRRDHFFLN